VLRITAAGLSLPDENIPEADVVGFAEHWDAWSQQAWLEIIGPGWRINVDSEYATLRRSLRRRFPAHRFHADWRAGRFPPAPSRWPFPMVWVSLIGVSSGVAFGLAWGVGAWAAALWLAVWMWPMARLHDRVEVTSDGLSLGPAWAASVPWHDVGAVYFHREGGRAVIWAKTPWGSTPTAVPVLLLPPLRARIRRLSGLEIAERLPDLDRRYGSWVQASAGIPWGVLVGGAASVWFLPRPWFGWILILLISATLGLLGASVRARNTGWGGGAVLWATVAYGVVLLAISLGGWL
jgi:hypothetical protein